MAVILGFWVGWYVCYGLIVKGLELGLVICLRGVVPGSLWAMSIWCGWFVVWCCGLSVGGF